MIRTANHPEQSALTEAEALDKHMSALFQDAFGPQRYASNRSRNRKLDVDRPVSQHFVLEAEYHPKDLVAASKYSVPVS
ncbi:MAG: hypothetical protein AAGG08_17190, partial [Actinomycetota bacterium]